MIKYKIGSVVSIDTAMLLEETYDDLRMRTYTPTPSFYGIVTDNLKVEWAVAG